MGSGDLFTAHDCLRMLAITGVDGVTVARGAIGNPWIFEQAQALADGHPLPPPPSLFQQRDVLSRHWQLAETLYGPKRTGAMMRKFGIKYSASHPGGTAVRQAFVRTRNQNDWESVLAEWYSEDLPGVYPTAEAHQVAGSGNNG